MNYQAERLAILNKVKKVSAENNIYLICPVLRTRLIKIKKKTLNNLK